MAGLRLNDLALLEFGTTINLEVEPGSSVCIVGPAGAGKSRLLRSIARLEKPTRGAVEGPAAFRAEPFGRKTKVQEVGRRRGNVGPNEQTEVLSALGLWEVRQQFVEELPKELFIACEIAEELMSESMLLVWDGKLDVVDPITRSGAMRLIGSNPTRNVVVTSNNLEACACFDYVIVLREYQSCFAGKTGDLAARDGVRSIEIESHMQPGLRALTEPFRAQVTREGSKIRIVAEEGQDLAASLLRDGYGDIRLLVTERRSLQEIILEMLRS